MTQMEMKFHDGTSFKEELARIRQEARDKRELGDWFEQLCIAMITHPETGYHIKEAHKWSDWPEREKLIRGIATDLGVDIVAIDNEGQRIAIQCKCYDEGREVRKSDIDTFLTESSRKERESEKLLFDRRWILSTTALNRNARATLDNIVPPAAHINFAREDFRKIEKPETIRPVRTPWPLQREAIDRCLKGLKDNDRGRLIMACGTGKTFTSLRLAEEWVEDGGLILFAAPSIALVTQSRREWLRHTVRDLSSIVVCSDAGAGGRGEDMRVSELECPVSTDPSVVKALMERTEKTKVVFSTYQSLSKVIEAQALGAPRFDLAFADEAHRTTGVMGDSQQVNFQSFHGLKDEGLGAHRRIYMTATPRIYTDKSKGNAADLGKHIIDMSDHAVYGPEFYRLRFKAAVDAEMLVDYKVIVIGIDSTKIGEAMRTRLLGDTSAQAKITDEEIMRMFGTRLAVSNRRVYDANHSEEEDHHYKPLVRTLAFASTINRSKWYKKAFNEPKTKEWTSKAIGPENALNFEAHHIDGKDSASERTRQINALRNASERKPMLLSNCKLFTEGVDVPTLDAVAFLDAKSSQIDIVQAVGRVMRKSEGKTQGFIIVPVIVDPGDNVADALCKDGKAFKVVGQVLRALQSHDERLTEDIARMVQFIDPVITPPPKDDPNPDDNPMQMQLALEPVDAGMYARLVANSGLRPLAANVAEEIAYTVKRAGGVFLTQVSAEPLAEALGRALPETEKEEHEICTTAALVLANGCLLHRRLRNEADILPGLASLEDILLRKIPASHLVSAWSTILERDYRPVFEPARAVAEVIEDWDSPPTTHAVKAIIEVSKNQADKLSDLGYDYAGPLYHKILASAKSDGAFYTKNTSALLLAGLALPTPDNPIWSDPERPRNLKIVDPACGTGTLLIAALQTLKKRMTAHSACDGLDVHRQYVEEGIYGFDINPQAVQMAASNLTFGATSVNYKKMNLYTLPHGVQDNGQVRGGGLRVSRPRQSRFVLTG